MHVWHGQVRDYELDIQKVVNNAVYLHYFEHARHLMLREAGIDFFQWHNKQLDFVLVEAKVKYKKSLSSGDEFRIVSTLKRYSKIRLLIEQTLYFSNSQITVSEAQFIAACIDKNRNKACIPNELLILLGDIA